MLLRERSTQEGPLVSVCDADVLGETFENDEASLTVDAEFYDGEEATAEEVVASLSRASVANLVGVRAVELAVEAGYVEEANVLVIDGTPHAQFMQL